MLEKRVRLITLLFLLTFLFVLSVAFRGPILVDGVDFIVYYLSAKNGFEYMIKSQVIVPMGFPLIIRFFLFFNPNESTLYFINPLFTSLSVVTSYLFAEELFDRKVGLISALLLMVKLLGVGAILMSDAPALFFLVTALYLSFLYTKNNRPVYAYTFFILSGLGFLVRYTNAIGLIIGGSWCFYKHKTNLLKRKEVWIGIFFFLLTITPQLIFNYITFGSPLTTGYHLFQTKGIQTFSFRYIFSTGGFERNVPNSLYYIMAFFSPSWVIPFYVIAFLSLFKEIKNNLDKLIMLFLWISPFFAFNMFYFYQSTRFLLPIDPPALMLIALGMVEASKVVNERTVTIKRKSINYRKVALFLLFIAVYLPLTVNQYDSVWGERTQSDARMQVYVWLRENTEENSIILHDLSSGVINYYSNRVAYDVNLVGKPVSYEEISQIIKNNENVYLIDEICIQSKEIYEKIRKNFNFTLIQRFTYRYQCVFRREYTFKIYKIS